MKYFLASFIGLSLVLLLTTLSSEYQEKKGISVELAPSKANPKKAIDATKVAAISKAGETSKVSTEEPKASQDLSESCSRISSPLSLNKPTRDKIEFLLGPCLKGDNGSLSGFSDEELLSGMSLIFENISPDLEDTFKNVLEELAHRMPDHPAVAKASLMPIGIKDPIEVKNHLLENFAEASAKNPNDPEIEAIEMFLAVTEKEEGALQALEEFSQLNPEEGIGHYYAASIHYMEGNGQKAKELLKRALEVDPNHPVLLHAHEFANGKSDRIAFISINGVGFEITASDLHHLFRR